ncbi:MAG: hypothetical protein IKS83_09280, partial [Victivallales bacterium]|nr:hypothetical protein [Victivallales bacterium]
GTVKYRYGLDGKGEGDVTGDVSVSPVVTLELTLAPGWNAVVLSLTPDEASVAKLRNFPAMALDPLNHTYIQTTEFTADGLYWLYATKAQRVLVTGEAGDGPMLPTAGGMVWQPYGTFPATKLEGFELWQWLEGAFRRIKPPQTEPGCGYFIKLKQVE